MYKPMTRARLVLALLGIVGALAINGCATAPLPAPPSPAEIAQTQRAAERAEAERQALALMKERAEGEWALVLPGQGAVRLVEQRNNRRFTFLKAGPASAPVAEK